MRRKLNREGYDVVTVRKSTDNEKMARTKMFKKIVVDSVFLWNKI